MAAGIVFDVAHDVRLWPVRRGPQPLLGPRLTTQLSGDTATSVVQIQELTATWEDLSGGGRMSASVSSPPDVTSVGQQGQLDRLMTVHRAPLQRARRPILPEPSAVNSHHVRRELRAAAVEQVMRLRLPTRQRLLQQADQRVNDEVARRIDLRTLAHTQDQAEADQWWQHLCDGHAEFAFSRLLTAFDSADLPAAVTAVGDRVAHVVMSIDTAEMIIGQREPTKAGTPGISLAIMNEGRRNRLYVKALCFGIVAVAAHALAVVPGIDTVNVAVVGLTQRAGPAVLAIAALPRSAVLLPGKDQPIIEDLFLAAQRGSVRLALERSTLDDPPQPLDPQSASVMAVLDAIDNR